MYYNNKRTSIHFCTFNVKLCKLFMHTVKLNNIIVINSGNVSGTFAPIFNSEDVLLPFQKLCIMRMSTYL